MLRLNKSNAGGSVRARSIHLAVAGLAVAWVSSMAAAGPITAGDLVVVQVGNGGAALNSAATVVFLKEYTTAGVGPVNTINLPTTLSGLNKRLTNSGTAGSEGFLSQSSNGLYLLQIGYDAAPGTAAIANSTSAANNRVVGRTDMFGNVDTTTALTETYSAANPRSAASNDGINIWTGGQQGTSPDGGVRYTTLGATSAIRLSSTVTNVRVVNIFAGQLYDSSSSGAFLGVSTVGVGLPTTSGQVTTLLTGFGANSPSSYDYAFLNSTTVYVADDSTTANGGGIQRWDRVSGTWTRSYVLNSGLTTGCLGVTLDSSGASPVIYATTNQGSPNSRIMKVTDTGSGSVFSLVATAPTNTVFKGIRYMSCLGAPTIGGGGQPADQSVCDGASASFTVSPTGTGTLSYQWRTGTTNLTNGGNIFNATTATLTINPAHSADAGSGATGYNCVVTNGCGNVTSSSATLTVITSCDDGNPCTDDTCNAGVCSHTNNSNSCASDGDPCTLDVCNGGACTHVVQDADGDGVCDASDQCPGTPNNETVNASGCSCSQINCDDGIPCTLDTCANGVCSHTPTGSCNRLSLNVVGSGMACAGSTLDVTLDASGLLQAINGVQVLLQYNPALLTLSSVSPGNGAGSPWDAATPIGLIDNAGAVTYALVLSGPGSAAAATVATLHFTVQLPGVNIDPTSVVFRPDQGQQQTKLVVASDNSTILPGKLDSGLITVGPRVTVSLQVQGLNHAVTRDVTFILTNCAAPSSPQVISRPVAFNASGIGNVVLTGIDTSAGYLAVVEGHTLQKRIPLSFTSCFATATLTGGSQLISGDLQTTGVPQDNLVDILDFAILAARWNTMVSDCPSGLPADCSYGADVNGDGAQDTADFTAIQINFFQIGDDVQACPPVRPKLGDSLVALDAGPQVSMPAARLAAAHPAMRDLGAADVNGDGVVDARDIRLFAAQRGLSLVPEFDARLRQLETSGAAGVQKSPALSGR